MLYIRFIMTLRKYKWKTNTQYLPTYLPTNNDKEFMRRDNNKFSSNI